MANWQDIRALEERIYDAVDEYLANSEAYKNAGLHVWLDEEDMIYRAEVDDNLAGSEEWEIGQKSTGKDAKKSTGKKLGKTAEKIVELMRDNPNITIPDLAIAVHTNERNIEKHTSNLQAKGIIRRVDGRKEGYWQVLI